MSEEEKKDTTVIEGINEKGEKFYIELGGPCPPVPSMFFPITEENQKKEKGELDGNSSQST